MPLQPFSKQLERLIAGYRMEILAMNHEPEQRLPLVKQFAKDFPGGTSLQRHYRIISKSP